MIFRKITSVEKIKLVLGECANTFYNKAICNEKVIDNLADKYNRYAEFYCCFTEDIIIGCIAFYSNDENKHIGFLSMIIVKKEYQAKGVGKKLLGLCIEKCIQRGMEKLRLEVNKNNINAINFYKKIDGIIIGEKEDSFIMEIMLKDKLLISGE